MRCGNKSRFQAFSYEQLILLLLCPSLLETRVYIEIVSLVID